MDTAPVTLSIPQPAYSVSTALFHYCGGGLSGVAFRGLAFNLRDRPFQSRPGRLVLESW